MKQFRTPWALAVCALALSACGSYTGEGKAAGESSGSLAAAKSVVVDYVGATFSGDAKACDFESEKYAAEQNESTGVADCAERVESIKAMLTDGEPLFDLDKVVVEVEQDGDAVLAMVGHETEDLDGAYRLVEVDGAWKIDGEVAGGASSGEVAGDDTAAPGEPRTISEDEAKAISSAFCAVKVGTTRAAVERILGEPSAEGTDADGQAEVDWFYNQDSYTVWFDAADTVRSSSSSTPREGDACEG